MTQAKNRVAFVVKGYPRLSETFVAQEILGLERRGLPIEIWSLRRPTDTIVHPMHEAIAAPCFYLPEYLHQAPLRVLRAFRKAQRWPAFPALMKTFRRDLRRDPSRNRIRRLGQAVVLADELDEGIGHLHVHFLHTPASVVRYAALLTGRTWTYSAHAKDIWTTPDWEKREKLAEARWGVTCTAEGQRHLAGLAPSPDRIDLLHHGLDLARMPPAPGRRPPRDASDPADPLRIVTVGRAVEKKGFDDLIAALASLPSDLHWRFAHLGGGPLLAKLKAQAAKAGIGARTTFLGAKAQPEVMALLAEADLFVLPSKEGHDGDRDGLPNVIMEAASQELAIVSTRFAAIPEFIRPGREGELVPPGDWAALSNAINLLARDPERRATYGAAASRRLQAEFSADAGLDWLTDRLAAVSGIELPAASVGTMRS